MTADLPQAGAPRTAGYACIAAAVSTLVWLPLHLVNSGPAPDGQVPATALFALLGLIPLTAVVLVLPRLADRPGETLLATAAGLLWVALQFISAVLGTGAAVQLYGSSARAAEGLFLVAVGIAVTDARALPWWTGPTAYLLAAINLAFVPAPHLGTQVGTFYAADGWGATAATGVPFIVWLLAIGASSVRTAPAAAAPAAAPVP